MAAPIEIPIASDTKAFALGVENGIIDPLEDAEKSLKDLAKAGDRAGDELDGSMRHAQRETKDTKRELDRMADAIEQAGRKGRSIGDGVKVGADQASDAVREFGDEAKQNLSETVSSFRGEAEDVAQIVQDTLGGVIGELGPAGLVLGTAGAVGIGLIMGAIEEAKEKEAEFRAQVAELADELIDAGNDGELSISQIADRMRELATATEDGAASLSTLRKDSKSTINSYQDLARAMAGNVEGLDEMIAKEQESLDKVQDARRYRSEAMKEQIGAQRRVIDGLTEQRDAMQEAQDAEAAWIAAGGPALEARAEQLESLQGELDEAVGSWKDYTDAETGATDPAAYIAAMQARMDATTNFNTNVQTLATQMGLTTDEVQAILDQGVDFAPMLQAIMDGGPEMQEQYAAQIRAMLDGGQAILDGQPTSASVEVSTNADAAEQELSDLIIDRTTSVDAEADTTAAETKLDAVVSKKRTATVGVNVDASAAETKLNNFVNRKRTATVTVEARDREGQLVP